MQTQHYDGDYGSFSNMCSGFSKPQKPSPSKNARLQSSRAVSDHHRHHHVSAAPHTVPDHPENLLYSGPVVLILFRQLRRYGLAMLLLKPLNIMPEKVEKHIYWTLVRSWRVLTEQRQGRNQG